MTKLELNGVHSVEPSRSPPPGIYAPTITIFTNDKKQDLDLGALAVHALRYPLHFSIKVLIKDLQGLVSLEL